MNRQPIKPFNTVFYQYLFYVFIIYYLGLLTALRIIFQGRTALWDSILILCHKIKVGYGGIVRGMHLGASALSILPVMETESED